MTVASPGVVAGALAGVFALFVLIWFRRGRSRLLAAACLTPLVALAAAIAHSGRQGRVEATDLDSNPTVFGAGGEAGASHAAGTGVVTSGGAEPPAKPSAVSAERVVEAVATAPGVSLAGAPEPYTPATLWNRMDGGAELYTRHGLVHAALATATAKGPAAPVEYEIQVFDLGTAEKAAALYAGVDRDPKSAPIAGLQGVTWSGGGEAAAGPFYLRIVAGAAEPAANEAEVSASILKAMAAVAGPSGSAAPSVPVAEKPPAASSAPTTPPPSPVPPPVAPTGPAVALGAPAHFAEIYGLARVVTHPHADGEVLEGPVASSLAAAALAEAMMPSGATRVGRFGWATEDACALPWGASIVVARGPKARARAEAVAVPPRRDEPAGLAAFAPADDVEPRVVGWGGRPGLGELLVGHVAGGAELVVATPTDPAAAWTALVASVGDRRERQGVLRGTDPVQGLLALGRAGPHLVIAAGFPGEDEARAAVKQALARLAP